VVRKTAACVPELRESANAYNQVTSSLIESAHIPILKVSSRPVSSARAWYMLMLCPAYFSPVKFLLHVLLRRFLSRMQVWSANKGMGDWHVVNGQKADCTHW
jgi:hypothetical protein